MTRSLPLIVAIFILACHPAVDMPGVPLYPNGATARLPRDQVAQVAGPIEKIDGQSVLDQGGVFDLLPGCHNVELDRRPPADSFALSSATYWSGQFPPTAYAFNMKAGGRYVIRRDIQADGTGPGKVILSAREEMPGGAITDLFPGTACP